MPFAAVLGRDSQACHPLGESPAGLGSKAESLQTALLLEICDGTLRRYLGFSNKIALPPFCALTGLCCAKQAVAGVITRGAAVGKELALHPQVQPKFS